jgi:hypothetical protein
LSAPITPSRAPVQHDEDCSAELISIAQKSAVLIGFGH